MNYGRLGESEQHDPGDDRNNWNTTHPRPPSMPAGTQSSDVGERFNNPYYLESGSNPVSSRSSNVPQLTVTPPAPAIYSGFNVGTPGPSTNFAMYQQHTWLPGGFPPSPPGESATAPGGSNSSSVTQPAAGVPNELKVQVNGKWFIALVHHGQHSIMDCDFAKSVLGLKGMPFQSADQLRELSTLTDGHTSGPKEFAKLSVHMPELGLENWKMAVALLPGTARNRPAPLLLGQNFFERVVKELGQISHRPNDIQLQREAASNPSVNSTNRMTPHVMHSATAIGGYVSTALGRRASSAGVNDNFIEPQTVNPRDLHHQPPSSYFGGAPPDAGGFS
ncbi:hypothetical protein QBC41DRAFT_130152 [Cercophora samala]|uniref:Uncharacterized protein n=1 Tax=Cercophora samala TaxID=330535 RepID=A0AA39ZBX0_9PEZI|nr:hypothetical protein QBC41DRAFT_130152 [Cercophora samala]